MRIAYLTQSYPPMISGAALAIQHLAEAMAQRGHHVLVIAASDKEHPYHTYTNNLTIIRLPSVHNPLRVNQRFLLFPYFAIRRALKKFQPDIIHVHDPLQTAWAGIAYARRQRIPITLTVHQVPSFVASYIPQKSGLRQHVEALLWTYARGLVKHFTSIIAPSYTTSGLLTSFTGIQTLTISNGIDLQKFHPPLHLDDETVTLTKLNLPSNQPIILHIGRLDTDKRVDCVIKASASVLQNTNAHLLIIGDGCEKNSLANLCNTLGIAQRVHFSNFISDRQFLSKIYRMASLFVTASEIETQGIVLLEAAASGLPIVAVEATCIPEIVHDQVNGYLTKPGDTHALGDAILKLLANPVQAKCMGQAGYELVQKHDIHNTMDLHEKLYRDAIKRMRTQRALQHQWKWTKGWMGLIK